MNRATAAVLVTAVVALLVLSMSVYTVDQRKAAIKFQLGEVIAVQTEPGLYFMVPAAAERAPLRHAHPDLRHRGPRALPHHARTRTSSSIRS